MCDPREIWYGLAERAVAHREFFESGTRFFMPRITGRLFTQVPIK
jgi:hypothetical protein